MRDQLNIDWSQVPVPADDGAAAHLMGKRVPALELPATDGSTVNLSSLTGLTVVYVYPRTGRPDQPLAEGWSEFPGARGCTPQSCAFRDHYEELRSAGVANLFGLSSQTSDYQREAAERLHLPFPLLSDSEFRLARALELPQLTFRGESYLRRLTMVLVDSIIEKVFYPVFPPHLNAEEVVRWLCSRA